MDGQPYKGCGDMKPKYEIGQTVYVKPNLVSYKVLGIMQLESGGYQYCLGYSQYWQNEKDLTDNNKKYFILYRSADGLELREPLEICHEIRQRQTRITKPGGCRIYDYTREDLSDDCKTSTYIYDEVI